MFPIGLRVVHLRNDLIDTAGGEGRVRLAAVLAAFRNPVGIGADGVVLVEAADDEHGVVRSAIADGYQRAYFWSEGSEGWVLCWSLGSQLS